MYIIVLCITIILFSLLSSYKIETFVDIEQSDKLKTPNHYVCQNFIQDSIDNNKLKWNMNFEDDDLKMLATLKTGIDNRYTDKKEQFTKNNCVIPSQHKTLFGFDDKCRMQGKDTTHQLAQPLDNINPKGCIIDLSDDTKYKNQNKFKTLLHDMHLHFNKYYLERIEFLKKVLEFLTTRNEDYIKDLEVSDEYTKRFNNFCNEYLIKRIESNFYEKVKNRENDFKTSIVSRIQQSIPIIYRDDINFQDKDLPEILKNMNVFSTAKQINDTETLNNTCESDKFNEMKKTFDNVKTSYDDKIKSNAKLVNATRDMRANLQDIKNKIEQLKELRDKFSKYK